MLYGEGGDKRCSPVGWVDSAEYFANDFRQHHVIPLKGRVNLA